MREEYIGNCRLILGDAREVLPRLQGLDAIVTDPPYGVAYSSGWDNKFKDKRIAGDEDLSARSFVVDWLGKRAGLFFGSWKMPKPEKTKATLIWDKGTVGMGDLNVPWFPATEEIYVLGTGFVGSRTSPVLRHYVRNEFHPTEKPVELMMALLDKCHPHWVVCDPFMGSGSTGVAAAKMKRAFVGIEIDQTHFETACRRIEQAYRQTDLFRDPPAPKPEQLALT